MIQVDSIRIDDDEGRFVLEVVTIDGDSHRYDIHAHVVEFYDAVRVGMGPYVAEYEHARATMPGPVDEYDDGYALDDPKSEGWYERMVG